MKILKICFLFVFLFVFGFGNFTGVAFAEEALESLVESAGAEEEGVLEETLEEVAQTAEISSQSEILQVKGKVLKIDKAYKSISGEVLTQGGVVSGMYEEQYVRIEILSGVDKGSVVTVKNDVYGNPFDVRLKEGNRVFLYGQRAADGAFEYFVRDRWHSDGLIFWSVVFLALILAVGGRAGVKALISLVSSILIIFFVFLPLVKNGYSPVPITVAVSAVIIFITHLIITGLGKKSWAAMLGTLGGVLVAVLMAYLISWSAGLSGLGAEEARTLAVSYADYDFRGLLFSGIILGALGAVMDVGISIASGLAEVKEHSPDISRKKLIKSGFNIGRDIMGSMINTLIFAYIGSSLVAIVLFYTLQTGVVELLNYDFIAEEIVRSLVGSLGLLATIPLTALLSGFLMAKK